MPGLMGALVQKTASFIHGKDEIKVNVVFVNSFLQWLVPMIEISFIECTPCIVVSVVDQ